MYVHVHNENSDDDDPQHELLQNVHRNSERAEHVAQLGERDALIVYLQAQLELRDAWMDEQDVNMDVYIAEMDAAFA